MLESGIKRSGEVLDPFMLVLLISLETGIIKFGVILEHRFPNLR